jgi:hypothetical protein
MINPATVVVYENRTSFTTIAPFVPVLADLRSINKLGSSISAYGWYDSMSFHIDGIPQARALFWLQYALGRMVRIVVMGETAWEGYINEVQAELPGATMLRSLQPMANRVYTTYSLNETAATKTTTASNDTDSQALYGIKEIYLVGGTMTDTQATNNSTRYLASNKNPPIVHSVTDRPPGTAGLTINCNGYYKTLLWRYYGSTVAGTQDSATTMDDIMDSVSSEFVNTSSLAATGRTAPKRFANSQTAWEQITSLAALGTSNDLKYFVGVKANRVLTGWEDPSVLNYSKLPGRPGEWYDATGGFPLEFWQIVPGKWLRVQLPPSDAQLLSALNPRNLQIGSCEYDWIQQTVTPQYGVTVPQIAKAVSGAEAVDPWGPWTRYEFQTQGWRQRFINGRWEYELAGWYRRSFPAGTPLWRMIPAGRRPEE